MLKNKAWIKKWHKKGRYELRVENLSSKIAQHITSYLLQIDSSLRSE